MSLIAGEKSIIISLAESANMVRLTFREAVLSMNKRELSGKVDSMLNYNHIPFMEAMMQDIFSDMSTFTYPDNIPPSTRLLIKDGLSEDIAVSLALTVFKLIIGEITTFIPDANFTEDGYRYNLCGEYDLHIAPPYLNELDDNSLDAEILNNNASFDVRRKY